MIRRHLSDDRLVAICLLESASLAEEQHLVGCVECDSRRARLQQLLREVAGAATADADAAFPASRLARQHAQILSRFQQAGRSARVISFPAGHSPAQPSVRTRPSMRLVAAAAIAGLVVGVVAGRFAYDDPRGRPIGARMVTERSVAPAAGQAAAAVAIRQVTSVASDEEFLSQIEVAIDAPATAALQPLDDLTPLPWEVR